MHRAMPLLLPVLLMLVACSGDCGRSSGEAPPARAPDGGAPRLAPGSPPAGEDTVVDPYCGMRLRRGEAAASLEHRGRTYYFCLEDHMEAFRRDPDRYISESEGDYGPDSEDGDGGISHRPGDGGTREGGAPEPATSEGGPPAADAS